MDLIFELVFWIIAATFNWLARPSQAPGESAKKAAGNRKKAQTDQVSFSLKGELGALAAQRPDLKGMARGEPEQDQSIQPKASPLEAKGVDVWAEHRKRQEAIEAEYKAKAPMNKTA